MPVYFKLSKYHVGAKDQILLLLDYPSRIVQVQARFFNYIFSLLEMKHETQKNS